MVQTPEHWVSDYSQRSLHPVAVNYFRWRSRMCWQILTRSSVVEVLDVFANYAIQMAMGVEKSGRRHFSLRQYSRADFMTWSIETARQHSSYSVYRLHNKPEHQATLENLKGEMKIIPLLPPSERCLSLTFEYTKCSTIPGGTDRSSLFLSVICIHAAIRGRTEPIGPLAPHNFAVPTDYNRQLEEPHALLQS